MIVDLVLCFGALLLLQIITPWWWWIMVVPFVFGVLRAKSGWYGFLLGTYAAGVLWLTSSIYYYLTSSQIIVHRVADMFDMGTPLLLILFTAVIAAFAGGVAGMTGYVLKRSCSKARP